MFAEILLSEQDFCPKTGGHFSEILLRGARGRRLIVSASYKTDIPAFYGDWFLNRLKAGFCRVVNPYNSRDRHVSLLPRDVDGIVFWTKNIGPMLDMLPQVADMGHCFYVQHGVTGYPRALELSVTPPEKAVGHILRLAERFGPRCVVWRYDPIVITDLTPLAWHIETFSALASRLRGSVDEVVVSFAHFYHKTLKNLDRSARTHGFGFRDPSDEEKRDLLTGLSAIARSHGVQLTVCAQPALVPATAKSSRCVDALRLSDLKGFPIRGSRAGNRRGCGCDQSVDVGEYDTCPHGCVYCYAVRHRDLARQRHRAHDPQGEFLFAPAHVAASPARAEQLKLF
jgi:hypothetical protein